MLSLFGKECFCFLLFGVILGEGGGKDLLASGGVDVATLAQRDLAVVTCARGGGAVGHARAGELLLNGLVDARLGG